MDNSPASSSAIPSYTIRTVQQLIPTVYPVHQKEKCGRINILWKPCILQRIPSLRFVRAIGRGYRGVRNALQLVHSRFEGEQLNNP